MLDISVSQSSSLLRAEMQTRLLIRKVRCLQVPGHRGQLHNQAIQLLAHLYLTAQSRSLGQAKCKIKHVVLVV